jgi:hypothetical protein
MMTNWYQKAMRPSRHPRPLTQLRMPPLKHKG